MICMHYFYRKFFGMKRPIEVYILCLLLLFVSLGALYGGGSLIVRPDGSLLGMQPWLHKQPFPNFLIPGIILFVLNGILPLAVIAGLLFKPEWRVLNHLNLYSEMHWSWAYSLYSGIIMIAWIVIQQFLTDYFIFQPMITSVGLLILIVTLTPRLMRYCAKK